MPCVRISGQAKNTLFSDKSNNVEQIYLYTLLIYFIGGNGIISGLRGINTKLTMIGGYARQFDFMFLIEFHSAGLYPFVKIDQNLLLDSSFSFEELRKDCNLTQKQLAEATGLSLSSIISYENGLREPNSRAMAVLESYFNISGEYLRGELDSESFFDKAEHVGKELDRVAVLSTTYNEAYKRARQDRQQISAEIYGDFLQFQADFILLDKSMVEFNGEQFQQLLQAFTLLNAEQNMQKPANSCIKQSLRFF